MEKDDYIEKLKSVNVTAWEGHGKFATNGRNI